MHVYVGSMGFDVVKEEKRHMILRLEDINDKKNVVFQIFRSVKVMFNLKYC